MESSGCTENISACKDTLTTTPISTFLSGKKKKPYIELIKGDSLFDFKIGGLNQRAGAVVLLQTNPWTSSSDSVVIGFFNPQTGGHLSQDAALDFGSSDTPDYLHLHSSPLLYFLIQDILQS